MFTPQTMRQKLSSITQLFKSVVVANETLITYIKEREGGGLSKFQVINRGARIRRKLSNLRSGDGLRWLSGNFAKHTSCRPNRRLSSLQNITQDRQLRHFVVNVCVYHYLSQGRLKKIVNWITNIFLVTKG